MRATELFAHRQELLRLKKLLPTGADQTRAIRLHRLRVWVRYTLTDHNGPGTDLPSGHEAAGHIRIVAGESLDGRARRGAEHEECRGGGVGQGAAQEQLAASERLAGEPKMLLPERGPARHKIIDHVIEQCEVVHIAPFPNPPSDL